MSEPKSLTMRKLIIYLVVKIGDIYSFIFARAMFVRLNNLLHYLALRGVGLYSMLGEQKFVKYLCEQIDDSSTIALDIGANEGRYSEYLLSSSRYIKVIGFEPHPKTFLRLTNNMSVFGERFSGRNLAVGSKEDKLELFDYAEGDGSSHASMFKDVFKQYSAGQLVSHDVRVVALDNELTEEEMSRIRFIKIDVEGNDKEVLVGAKKLVEKAGDNLYAIQIEFGECSISSRTFVRDIIELLPGFDVYRMLPSGKLLSLSGSLDWQLEIFAYQNLVFLNKANKTKLY